MSGLIADRPGVDALFMTFLALLTGAFCPFLMTLCYDFWSYAVVCIMFGITLSAWPALSSTMLVELLGLELLTSAFGVLTMIRGAGAFLGAPFGGFVLDAVGARTDMGNFTLAATMVSNSFCCATEGLNSSVVGQLIPKPQTRLYTTF